MQRAMALILLGVVRASHKPEGWTDNIIHSETIDVIDEAHSMNLASEIGFAAAWVLMMGCIPLLTRRISGQPMTRIQMGVAFTLWLALFGGMYLFCNVILFNSAHFSEQRTLYLVECIYLMSQVITTVGYGDITPAFPRGQIFIALYVLMAIFVIANIVSDLINHLAGQAALYKSNLRADQHKEQHDHASNPEDARLQKEHAALMVVKIEQRPSMLPFFGTLGVFFCFAGVWVAFFHLYPGEGKTVFQATYMSIITLSTVGFGAFLPQTHGGMVFAAFWMIFGSAALVAVVTKFTELMLKYSEYERFDPNEVTKSLKEWSTKTSSDGMNEADFVAFGLQSGGHVSEREVALARESFRRLQSGGVVRVETLRSQTQAAGVPTQQQLRV